MRILVISNLFPPEVLGGYEILCEQVCDLLYARGHEIKVLTTGDVKRQDEHAYTVERSLRLYLPFSRAAQFLRMSRVSTSRRNKRETKAAIDAYQPNIIFIWSQLRLTTGSAQAAEDSGRVVAYTMNDEHLAGYLSRKDGWTQALTRFLDERILHIGAAPLKLRNTTCISQTVKTRLCASGLRIPSACVIFQGIPMKMFPCKAEPGKMGAVVKVLYVGQLHEYKGVHTVIEAAGHLHRQGKRIEVTICGKGPADYEARLRQLAEAAGANVVFLGQMAHQELPDIYRSHDLFVFPSMWAEPFGLTHLEAMASGTPVVSTAEGGQGEFLRHDGNAYIFTPNSVSELAERIQTLMEYPETATRIAIAARMQVEQEFSLDAYTDRLETWLQSLV